MANGQGQQPQQQLPLTPAELEALLNILTHSQTFDEVRGLRYEANMGRFGPPATPASAGPTPFPLLQQLTANVVSPNLFTPQGWANQMSLGQRLAAANLSDSYDKGFVGMRKDMATGLAATVESVTRGFLVGRSRDPSVNLATLKNQTYDRSDASVLEHAWDDAVQGMMYGDLLDRVFDCVKQTPELDDVPPVCKAALDYFLVCASTVIHYFTVLTPEGQNIIKMLDVVDTLTPYTIIKQTVRLGNVQSMLNGITKIALAKVNDKNLVQTIVSKAIKLDLHDLEKKAEKMVKKKELPKEAAAAVEDYVNQPRSTQEQYRRRSQRENKSIVAIILESFYPTHPPSEVQAMSEAHHTAALQYLSLKLSIRDRVQGVQAICKDKPDILSDVVKESMFLLEPLLKTLHDGKFDIGKVINLQKTFLEDFIKTAKITKNYKPGVADFFAFYTRMMPAIWRILHEGATRCPSLHGAVYEWCRDALDKFHGHDAQFGDLKTGSMTGPLLAMYERLPTEQRGPIREVLNNHAVYMTESRNQSRRKLQDVLNRQSSPEIIGPGPILPRWHSLLDSTLVTPADLNGPVRLAQSLEGAASRQQHTVAPDTTIVVQSLGPTFREYLMANGGGAFSMKGMAGSLHRAALMDPVDSLASEKVGAMAEVYRI